MILSNFLFIFIINKMTAWSDHVRRYAKKHKMSYQQANTNPKCKEAYQKKRKEE